MSDAPGPRGPAAPPAPEPVAPYRKYRARPRLLPGRGGDGFSELRPAPGEDGGRPRTRKRWTKWRVARWVLGVVVGWILLALVLFLVSAGFGHAPKGVDAVLDDAGYPLWSANNILVLGSDARPPGSKEPGADPNGPSRSDSIILLRVGGGHSARLSIARDTLVNIPGYGTSKINAAYAYGGPALTIKTIKAYLGIPINHVILVDFNHFPKLIDALGGIDYTGGCVLSKINGGTKNGGFTLRLKKGTSHLNGAQALALARTRENLCAPNQTDLNRAAHQQQVISDMKGKLATPGGLLGIPHGSFWRLPWVGWEAPRAFRTDMSGPTMAGVFGAMAVGGNPKTQVLGTLSGVVPESMKAAMVRRFMNG